MSITVGIDPSYTESGIVVLDTDTGKLLKQKVIKTNNQLSEIVRVRNIWNNIENLIENRIIDVVSLEGLAFNSHNKAHQIGYLHFRIREYLKEYESHPKLIIPSPSQLKKFVTGKGQSKKELVLLNTYKQWGIEFTNNNLADAYGLAQLGRAVIGAEIKLHKYQQEAIEKLIA